MNVVVASAAAAPHPASPDHVSTVRPSARNGLRLHREGLLLEPDEQLMNKQWLDAMWDHMRQKYGIYLRVLDGLPEDAFHGQPIRDMRSPAQLVAHTSGSILRDVAEGVASGKINPGESNEDEVAAGLTSKEDVLAYAHACWDRANAAIAQVTDEKLAGPVENAWGIPLNGFFAMVVINDEFLHHRGQLFAYSRACGIEPPFMWGFEDNPPGFQSSGPGA